MSLESEITQEEIIQVPLPQKKGSRWIKITLGIVLIVGFAGGGLFLQLTPEPEIKVLAASRAIPRGQILRESDLRVVEVPEDLAVAYIREANKNVIIGRISTYRIEPGTLLTARIFSITTPLSRSEAIIGVALDAGQYPIQPLLRGDLVDVIIFESNAQSNTANFGARAAEVFDVTEIGGQTRLLISLRVSKSATTSIAAAASQGRVWLTLVTE